MVGCRDSSNLFLIQFTEVAHELEKGPDRIVGITVVWCLTVSVEKTNNLSWGAGRRTQWIMRGQIKKIIHWVALHATWLDFVIIISTLNSNRSNSYSRLSQRLG